ncbi:MAG: phospholipase D-like domain-containing protein [Planctomycetota bacterium]
MTTRAANPLKKLCFAIAILVAACAGTREQADDNCAIRDAAEINSAYIDGHRIVIALDDGRFAANLDGGALEAFGPEVRTGAAAVEVRGTEEWNRRLAEALDSLAPAEGGCVVDLFARDELFVYRDRDGVVRSVPVTEKPAAIPVVRAYRFEDVARALAKAQQPALYVTGESGYPLVFADSGRVAFLADRDEPAKARGAGLRLATTTLGGQLKAMVHRPGSSMGRFFTMTATSAADLIKPEPLAVLRNKPIPDVAEREFMDRAEWERELDARTGTRSSTGTMRYRVDGHEFYPRLIEETVAARESIDCRVYIFDNDDYAVDMADLLRRKSADVSVRVLTDNMGTRAATMAHSESLPAGHRPPECILRYLRDGSAVEARAVENPWFAGDHTKAIVIDRTVAFVGGMNIGREYRYDWHDLMVELEGPVVGEIAADFDRAWAGSESFGDFRRKPRHVASTGNGYPIRLLQTKPGDSQIYKAQLAAIRRAQKRIYIETPYLTSDTIIFELARARRRGVDVRVILPAEGDSALINKNHAHAANALIRNGIRVYIYPGMSHLKAAVYDGWACVGSANMDNLSLRVNREMNVATSHPPAVQDLIGRVFEPDFARSREMTEPVKTDLSHLFAEFISDGL